MSRNIYISEPPTKGKVLLVTSKGEIDIELWAKEAPKACRNFVQLCLEQYYDNVIFHRILKGFMVQTGDPTGTGRGGESVYGEPFADEFHQRLRFSRRGIVGMANSGEANDNSSQFFITTGACEHLNRVHTIFGKVTGETIFNVLRIEETEVDGEGRPEEISSAPKILRTEVLVNPFSDIVPRVVENEIIPQDEELEGEKKKKRKKKKTKDTKLLSFGDEEEEEGGAGGSGGESKANNEEGKEGNSVGSSRVKKFEIKNVFEATAGGKKKKKKSKKEKKHEKEKEEGPEKNESSEEIMTRGKQEENFVDKGKAYFAYEGEMEDPGRKGSDVDHRDVGNEEGRDLGVIASASRNGKRDTSEEENSKKINSGSKKRKRNEGLEYLAKQREAFAAKTRKGMSKADREKMTLAALSDFSSVLKGGGKNKVVKTGEEDSWMHHRLKFEKDDGGVDPNRKDEDDWEIIDPRLKQNGSSRGADNRSHSKHSSSSRRKGK
eukprot:Nk52_evm17s266 gene=Nk52_evmTU17s266